MSVLSDIGSKFSNIITPSSIDSLKGTIGKHQGLARTNRFAIVITPPEQSLLNLDVQSQVTNLLSGGSFNFKSLINDPRDMTLFCESSSFPGRNISSMNYGSIQQEIKVPTTFFNEDVQFTFLLSNDYFIKKTFDRWLELVINSDKYRLGYMNEYSRDVVIQQLNQRNLVTYGIRLKEAWPVSVNSIDLSNADESNLVRLNVTFTYRNYVPEKSVSSTLGGIKTAIGGITRLI